MMNESSIDKGLIHWGEYKVENHKLSRRCYHASILYEDEMYVYGGYEANTGLLSDFWKVDLSTSTIDKGLLEWQEILVLGEVKPGPLCRASSILY